LRGYNFTLWRLCFKLGKTSQKPVRDSKTHRGKAIEKIERKTHLTSHIGVKQKEKGKKEIRERKEERRNRAELNFYFVF